LVKNFTFLAPVYNIRDWTIKQHYTLNRKITCI